MKKLFVIASFGCMAISCGSNNNNPPKTDSTANKPEAKATDPETAKGLDLIVKSDCLTCHKVSEQSVGPAYVAVATKYAGAGDKVIDTLSDKVIKGGSGKWGSIPMTPHPQISKQDAEAMVKYVLSLKNNQ